MRSKQFKLFFLGAFIGAAAVVFSKAKRQATPAPAAPGDILVAPMAPSVATIANGLFLVTLVGVLAWRPIEQGINTAAVAKALTHGDASRAPALMITFGCAGCHTIDGVPGADGKVGPPLHGLVHRVYIGGTAENTTSNLVRWIVNPQQFSPQSAMPPPGLTTKEARDIAAYLYAN